MKENLKIVAVEPIGIDEQKEEELRKEFATFGCTFTLYKDRKEDNQTLIDRIADNDIAIVSNIPLTKDVLSQCKNLKLLAIAFTGIDHIDLEYCKANNIEIINASGYATQGVSELSIGLMIDVIRKISLFNDSIRKQGTRNNYLGLELKDRTIGIVGTGKIGTRTAMICKAFGAKVIAFSHNAMPLVEREGIEYMDLPSLMAQSDIISIHVPLNESTYHLISKQMLELCKPNCVIINTSRGNVVDMEYLSRMLNEDRLFGAGIDVYENEPPLKTDHPLLHCKNCICTPHIAFATKESFDSRIEIVKNNIVKWLGK